MRVRVQVDAEVELPDGIDVDTLGLVRPLPLYIQSSAMTDYIAIHINPTRCETTFTGIP